MNTIPRAGDRIRLLEMNDDPSPVPVGEEGTVVGIHHIGEDPDAWHQIDVTWDNGRTLMLVSPPDRFEVLGPAEP